MSCKDFNKFLKKLLKTNSFTTSTESRKNTIKLKHKDTGYMYTIHPGDAAITPLKSWLKRNFNIEL